MFLTGRKKAVRQLLKGKGRRGQMIGKLKERAKGLKGISLR